LTGVTVWLAVVPLPLFNTLVPACRNPTNGTTAALIGVVVSGQVPLVIRPFVSNLLVSRLYSFVPSLELPLKRPIVVLAVVPDAVPLRYG
jgi:hypothetical protein